MDFFLSVTVFFDKLAGLYIYFGGNQMCYPQTGTERSQQEFRGGGNDDVVLLLLLQVP